MKINRNIYMSGNVSTYTNEIVNIYFSHFKKTPNLIDIQSVFDVKKISKYLLKQGFKKSEHIRYRSFDDKEPNRLCSFLLKEKKIYISLSVYNICFLYDENTPDEYISEFSNKKYNIEENNNKLLYIILPDKDGYKTSSHTLTKTEFIPENYNEDFIPIHEDIIKSLNENKSGLYLMYGTPGTGKSSYLSSLTQMNSNKKFVYLPSYLFTSLDSPVLMKLLIANANSVFIIEDGEKLLINRENESNSPISALLNMSDGLIGQVLNSQIICTFNTSLDKIDAALLRNGRLINMYEFKPLEKDRAINLAKKLNKPHEHINGPTTLADIYNQSDKVKEIKPRRKSIGFASNSI